LQKNTQNRFFFVKSNTFYFWPAKAGSGGARQ
jgi:hypothetical protein